MLQRREVWNRLKPETQKFVIEYLKNNLKLKENEFENFLFPDFQKNLLDARAMEGVEKAVERILLALQEDEKIAVYGDYDCDGVPGTALLRDFFEKINYNRVVYYIPHRHTEGYGLNKKAIDILAEQGVSLMITIDLGTTNIEEVEYANNLKIDTIITDHHLPLETEDGQLLPNAFAIINNKQASCNYANKDLCGSGTLYKLVCELIRKAKSNECKNQSSVIENIKKIKDGYEKWLLDLVAIATIADMVPLTNENRNLTIYGLYVLQKTNRAGLQTLFRNSKTDIKKVTETDIAFTVAPRINSASRMAHPKIALSMYRLQFGKKEHVSGQKFLGKFGEFFPVAFV
jgi:single-stranded-DNA-specific exonuclease